MPGHRAARALRGSRGSGTSCRAGSARPCTNAEIERTQLANDVAIKVIHYRVSRGLSQAELARMIRMRQPNVARLESGDHEPSLSTLARLSLVLGVDFSVDIKRGRLKLRNPVRGNAATARERPAHGGRRRRASPPQRDRQMAG